MEPAHPTTGNSRFEACIEKTAPSNSYSKKAHSIWSPRLESPDDIELTKSRLVRNPFARFVLFIVESFQTIKNAIRRLRSALYPRRPRIYGTYNTGSTVVGQLVFGQKLDDLDVPLHHIQLELWGRKILGGYRKLGEDISDRDGLFTIPYDLNYVHHWWMRRVWVEVYITGHHKWRDGRLLRAYSLFKKIPIQKGDLVGIQLSLGVQQLFYWEYRRDTPVPRVVIEDFDKNAPDAYSPGRIDTMERQFVPIELIKLDHLEQIRLRPGTLTYEQIQAAYPENLTICIEKQQPGYTRGDDWFGERMMNGMFAINMDKDPENPELYWVHHHWNSYDKNTEYAMPDVDMRFRLKPDGLLLPVEITLTGPLNAYELGTRPKRTFRPGDGDAWLAAKRAARVSGALYTELVNHFSSTHLNTEQYAIATFRNLHLNPIATLLMSHVRAVVLVNHTADRILVGNGYITTACALTPKGIDQVVENVMGTLDWKNWRPIPPLSDAHVYARAANMFWEITTQYVSEFIEENAIAIRQHWYEVYCFSRDLVNHSVPSFLCKYLQGALLDKDGKPKRGGIPSWYQNEDRMDLNEARPVIEGELKALSYITQNPEGEQVSETDWKNLKDACTYIIFQATFGHSWANSKQYDDIGEFMYSSLGLRFGTGPDGVLAPESDTRIAPDLTRATQMMWWSNTLSRTGYGFIMANEDGDVNPRLIELLGQRRADFAALGVDIDTIQSRTNI